MDLGSAGSIARALGVWGEDHQREDLEQYLRADHYGVAGRVVLRATSTTSPPMRNMRDTATRARKRVAKGADRIE